MSKGTRLWRRIALRRLLLVGLLVLPSWQAGAAISVTDATGERVTLPSPAQRIVSLAPHLTENLFAIDEGHRLVGTSTYSLQPPAARDIPRVGTHDRLDMERITALDPDLILLWLSGNGLDQAERLRDLGFTVVATESGNLREIADTLRLLGRVTGTDRGRLRAERFTKALDKLTERYAGRDPVRAFYQVWQEPLMTIGGEQMISDVMARCGARNVFAEETSKAFAVSREAVIARQPQVLIASRGDDETGDPLAHWHSARSVPAVRQGQMVVLEGGALARPTPAILGAARELCRAVDAVRQSPDSRTTTQE